MTTDPDNERDGAVVLAYLHTNEVAYSWHHSMVEMVAHDLVHEARVVRGGYIAYRCSSGGIVDARNRVAVDFLADNRADWLCWIDTDMGFPADMIDRLMEVADPVERPIVGALAFGQREQFSDGMGGWRCQAVPTIYDWMHAEEDQMGFAVRWQYPLNSLVRVGGTGSACILIHRSAFEAIEAKYGRTWYDLIPNTTTGQVLSEDLAFCLRAGTLTIPVHVHTGVKTTHAKRMWVAEEDYWRQVVMDAQRPGASIAVDPATEPVAVLVPVLNRPQNAEPFMRTLRASTGLATAYALAHEDDTETIAAWEAAGAWVITGDVTTFAEKVNLGYRSTSEPWLFLVGDDVAFRAGWLDQAEAMARDSFHVVGTNDLGNPRVTSGEHATHLLVRRSYVDELGASWDGPGAVCHEGYKHWYVDDEIVTTAKQRGVWAPALTSIVEHLHPLFGKGESDSTYRLGQSFAEQDKALFEQRVAEHA